MVLLHVRALAGAMSIVCGLGVLLGIAYTITASVLVGRFFSRAAAEPRDYPGVTVAKPLHGDEWQLVQHLESFVQNYPPGPAPVRRARRERQGARGRRGAAGALP